MLSLRKMNQRLMQVNLKKINWLMDNLPKSQLQIKKEEIKQISMNMVMDFG